MAPPWAAVPLTRTHFRVGSPWAAVLQDNPAPPWALHGPQLLQGICTCSRVRFSMGCSVMSPETARKCLLHHSFFHKFHGLKGSLCCGAHNSLLIEATPAASPPPANKTLPCKPNTISNWNLTILTQTTLNIWTANSLETEK